MEKAVVNNLTKISIVAVAILIGQQTMASGLIETVDNAAASLLDHAYSAKNTDVADGLISGFPDEAKHEYNDFRVYSSYRNDGSQYALQGSDGGKRGAYYIPRGPGAGTVQMLNITPDNTMVRAAFKWPTDSMGKVEFVSGGAEHAQREKSIFGMQYHTKNNVYYMGHAFTVEQLENGQIVRVRRSWSKKNWETNDRWELDSRDDDYIQGQIQRKDASGDYRTYAFGLNIDTKTTKVLDETIIYDRLQVLVFDIPSGKYLKQTYDLPGFDIWPKDTNIQIAAGVKPRTSEEVTTQLLEQMGLLAEMKVWHPVAARTAVTDDAAEIVK